MAYNKTQQARMDAGLCRDCGKPRGDDGTSGLCGACSQRAAERSTQRKARLRKEWNAIQLCFGCGAQRDNNTKLCTACRNKQNERKRGYATITRQKYTEQGLCKRCGKERYHESNYCRYHFIENIARQYSIPGDLWEDILIQLEASNFICFYTGIQLIPGKNASIDHLHSRSQYPDKISDLDNLVWCDKWINRMKGHMSYQDFITLCRTIVDRAKVS